MKRFPALPLFALWTVLVSTSVALAQNDNGRDKASFEALSHAEVKTWEQNGATIVEVSRALKERDVGTSRLLPNMDVLPNGLVTVGGHTVEYASAVGHQGSSYVWHAYARTTKISGSGSYRAHAHAALNEGNSSGVSYSDPTVFGNPPTACATDERTNATAQTCESPHFSTYSGQWWYFISSHRYDVGANGTWDDICAGCFDWKFRVP